MKNVSALKRNTAIFLTTLASAWLLALASVWADSIPRTYARFVPERADDFAWENDKVAFRAYGPALREGSENGGIDCWFKRVDYPIIDKWYKADLEGTSYHEDHGEGYDPYPVGSSLGCGGIGLWVDGKLVNSETFVSWKIIRSEPAETVFELSYSWDFAGHNYREIKRISIVLGDRLFRSVSTFWQDGELAVGLPIAVGLSTHDGKARVSTDIDKGWIACWEDFDGFGLGTGVLMEPGAIAEYKLIESQQADESHALLITKTDARGQVTYWAGYGWEKAGEIKNPGQWHAYLENFSANN